MGIFSLLILVAAHCIAALSLTKPRFNKKITALIWSGYVGLFIIMGLVKCDVAIGFFISFSVYVVLFLGSSVGSLHSKIFLLLSYSITAIAYVSTIFIISLQIRNILWSIVIPLIVLSLLLGVLIKVFLPQFNKVQKHLDRMYLPYNILNVLFLILVVMQGLYPFKLSLDNKAGIGMYILTMIIYYVTFIIMFHNIVQIAETKKWYDLANNDSITQFYNRTAYLTYVDTLYSQHKELIPDKNKYALLCLDINNFRKINDDMGHKQGDLILKNTAQMLENCFNFPNTKFFRLSGDEFVVVTEDIPKETLLGCIHKLNILLDDSLNISMAIGYAFIDFESFDPVNQAYKTADKMMYRSKQQWYKNK